MSYDFSKVNVLVVESSDEMYQLFKNVLYALSVPAQNIHAAHSLDTAYVSFKNTRHDIIITDWLQSADHGIQLSHRIRKDPNSPNRFVPIIMTAGSGHYSRVIRSRDAGISEYLVKPFSAGELAKRITRVIESPRVFVDSDGYTGPDRRIKDLPFEGDDRRQEEPPVVDHNE